ncbi:MAG: TIGR03435 family protein [Terracidiphilus sp.]
MLRSLILGVLTVSAFGQIPTSGSSDNSAATPRFQVATIKPSSPEESRTLQIRGNRFATTDTSLVDLLKYAFGIQEKEIVGGPKWLTTQKFDLVGDPETPTRPSSDDFKKMVQNLLTDRFHFTAHHETRDLSVFEIVAAKSGPNLNKSTRPPNQIPGVGYLPGQLTASNATMADFAAFLQRFVTDRPVFDGTGITGRYDLALRWTPDELQTEGGRSGDDTNNSLPGLYTAIQEQLGLKLQEERRPAQVFVIDHADMPSEN